MRSEHLVTLVAQQQTQIEMLTRLLDPFKAKVI